MVKYSLLVTGNEIAEFRGYPFSIHIIGCSCDIILVHKLQIHSL